VAGLLCAVVAAFGGYLVAGSASASAAEQGRPSPHAPAHAINVRISPLRAFAAGAS
jgi:hypothetical protein